jgi:hypothetical protein
VLTLTPGTTAEAGNAFLVLDVTIKNTDTEGRRFVEGSLVVTVAGRQLVFDHTETVVTGTGFLWLETLNPLTTRRGKVVYMIPDRLEGDAYWVPGRDDKRISLKLPEDAKAPPAVASEPTAAEKSAALTTRLVAPTAQDRRAPACYANVTAMEAVTLVGTLSAETMGRTFAVVSQTRGSVSAFASSGPVEDLLDKPVKVAVTGTIQTMCTEENARANQERCWSFDVSRPISVVPVSDPATAVSTTKRIRCRVSRKRH